MLLLCAGVEMDARLAALCASARRIAAAMGVTFGLALAALDAPHWSALAPVGRCGAGGWWNSTNRRGVARGRLRIDERMLHYLAGVNYLDVRLRSLLRPADAADCHGRDASRGRRRRAPTPWKWQPQTMRRWCG